MKKTMILLAALPLMMTTLSVSAKTVSFDVKAHYVLNKKGELSKTDSTMFNFKGTDKKGAENIVKHMASHKGAATMGMFGQLGQGLGGLVGGVLDMPMNLIGGMMGGGMMGGQQKQQPQVVYMQAPAPQPQYRQAPPPQYRQAAPQGYPQQRRMAPQRGYPAAAPAA